MEGHSWRGSATGSRLPCVGIYSAGFSGWTSASSLSRVRANNQGEGAGLAGAVQLVDSCMKHTTYHGIISNYNKSSIVQVINRV